jgi:hypothetical protein
MKRLLVFAAVVVMAAMAPSPLLAQSNPFVGTWKLNLAKTKFTGTPLKEQTVTIQMVGDQAQVTGTAADGSPLKYEVPDKGGAGKFLTGPFDAVSGKWIDNNTREVTWMKDGKEMVHIHSVVSTDGKTMTNTTKGIDEKGKPFSRVAIWEKQ